MEIETLDGGWGARISGVRVTELDEGGFARFCDALKEHALVVLPAQGLAKNEQIAFTRRFGRFERLVTTEGRMDSSGRELTILTNRARTGEETARTRRRLQLATGNELWHADSSFKPVLAKFAFLSARTVPREGGQTEFADMRAAYDALDQPDRSLVEKLCAVHDYAWSQRASGEALTHTEEQLPPVTRPLVLRHPETGRSSLLLGRHIRSVVGMDDSEAEALLGRLLEHSTRRPFVYCHNWKEGDLVVWDNRCLLHRARPWPADQVRAMARTTVAGDGDNPWAMS